MRHFEGRPFFVGRLSTATVPATVVATPTIPAPTPALAVSRWRRMPTTVSELVALMASTSMAAEFDGLTESARASALRLWVRASDDAAAVDETVDMLLARESDGSGCLVCAGQREVRDEVILGRVHILCRSLSTLDEAWCTGAGRDDGRPNGRQ